MALAAAVALVFGASVGFGYIYLDDPTYVFANPLVVGGWSGAKVWRAFTDFTYSAIWMPFTWLSYMVFGRGAGVQHLVNVALHAVNTILVFKLFCCAVGSRTLLVGEDGERTASIPQLFIIHYSLFISLLWALHPQRLEPVCWIAARKELLWSFFALWALVRVARGRLALAPLLLLTLAAGMCKPTAMVLPVLIAVWTKERDWRRLLPLLGLGAVIGAIAMYSQTHPAGMAEQQLFTAPLWVRIANAVNAVGLYLTQLIVPVGIHIDYRMLPGLPALWYVGLPVAGVACWFGRRNRWFWLMVLALAPTLGVFGSFGEAARADRFFYLPAVFAMLWLMSTQADLKRLKLTLTGLLCLFAACTLFLLPTWRNDEAVFRRALACDNDHWRALAHVGEAECKAAKFEEGMAKLRRSQELSPHPSTLRRIRNAENYRKVVR